MAKKNAYLSWNDLGERENEDLTNTEL